MYIQINNYFESNEFFIKSQHGFRKNTNEYQQLIVDFIGKECFDLKHSFDLVHSEHVLSCIKFLIIVNIIVLPVLILSRLMLIF
jgi:hypothetical protein